MLEGGVELGSSESSSCSSGRVDTGDSGGTTPPSVSMSERTRSACSSASVVEGSRCCAVSYALSAS